MENEVLDIYVCTECGSFNHEGSDVYIIKDFGILNKTYGDVSYPFCSLECVEKYKEKEIEKLKDKIEEIKNSVIKKDIW